jgi:hypothetical protein
MNRKPIQRLVVLAFLALAALGSVACNASVGVGVSVPIFGGYGRGYGGFGGSRPYGGVYVGVPIWP